MNEQNKVEKLNGGKDEGLLDPRGAKLKASNDRCRARLTEVLSIAEKVLIQTVHSEGYKPGQYGQDYKDLGKAIAEIRTICKHDLSGNFPDYEWMAGMMTSEHFDPKRLEEEIAAKASEKPVDYPTFYTPGWLCELAKKLEAGEKDRINRIDRIEGSENPVNPVNPVNILPLRIPGGFDGAEIGEEESNNPNNPNNRTILTGYEKWMTLPNGSRLVRFHGSDTIRLMTSRKGKNGNPNNLFDIFVAKSTKKAFVRRDDTMLFTIEGWSVGYNVVEQLAVSALKRYMKDRMSDNARHKRRRAAKRAAATKALIEKELA